MKKILFIAFFALVAFQGFANTETNLTHAENSTSSEYHSEKMDIYPPATQPVNRTIFWAALISGLIGFVGMVHRIVHLQTNISTTRRFF